MHLRDFYSWVVKVLVGIGVGFLLAVMLVFVGNVIFRGLGKPILGTYEMISFCMVPVISFAIGYTALTGGHVVVDVVFALLHRRVRKVLGAITTSLSIAFWTLTAWKSTEFAMRQWARGETTEQLALPIPLFRMIWAFGLYFLVLVLCIQLIQGRRRRGDG